jgi:prepilin-type N-terminal cleavage/methylation domain-containing protein
MRTTRRGFTFIELLCVIAVIAVLAAILFPVFAQARERARTASCASSLQQIAIAMHLYAEEYNGRLPPEDDHFLPIMPFVKNYAIFRCPSDPTPFKRELVRTPPFEVAGTGMPSPGSWSPLETSYVYRGGLRNDDWGDIPLAGERLEERHGSPPDFESLFPHSRGANRVHLDGSVKWIRGRYWQPINAAQKAELDRLGPRPKDGDMGGAR